MKKKVIAVIGAILFVTIIIAAVLIGKVVKQHMPTKKEANVYEYFGISQVSDLESYTQAFNNGESVVPIELNRSLTEEMAFCKDGQMYLDYDYVHDTLNKRFYWDANENVLLYTTASDLIKAEADSKDYYIGKKKTDKENYISLSVFCYAYLSDLYIYS